MSHRAATFQGPGESGVEPVMGYLLRAFRPSLTKSGRLAALADWPIPGNALLRNQQVAHPVNSGPFPGGGFDRWRAL